MSPLKTALWILIALVVIAVCPGGKAGADTIAFAHWEIVPSSYPPAPFSNQLRVFEFGAAHESYPFYRSRFAASVETMMRSDSRGGRIASVDYRIGYWISPPDWFIPLDRVELGLNHGSWHNSDFTGRTQAFTRVELNLRL
jgi:hypothetical protein